MFSPLMKLSCAAVLCSTLAIAGCNAVESDAAKADRQVSEYLAKGDLAKAAAVTSASAPVRARVLSLLAADEVAKAKVAQKAIDENVASVRLYSSEMTLLASNIQSATLMAEAAKKVDPAPFQKTANDRAEQLSGKDTPEWFKTGPISVATKAALEQRLTTLQADIKKIEEQKAAAQAQRNKLLADADTLTATPVEDKKQSLEQYHKATGMRKQAGDLGIDIDKLNAQELPLQQDVEVTKVQIAAIDKAIKDLQQHAASAGKAWSDIQKNVADQAAAAAKLAKADGPATQPGQRTIAEAARLMDEAVGRAKTAMDDAAKNLSTAADYTDQAAKLANDYGGELRKKKSEKEQSGMVADWTLMEAATHPANYQLQRAALLRAEGLLTASRADLLATRASAIETVAPVLKAAGLEVPPSLQSDPAVARKEAADAYKAALDQIDASAKQLDGLAVIGQDDRIDADKNVQTVLNNFVLARIYRSTGDAQKADSLQTSAVTLAKDLAAKGRAIPSLPVQITEPPAKPVTPPTPPPATAPATAPATPETPA